MSIRRVSVLTALVTIVALAIFVGWMVPRGTLPASLVVTTFGVLGLSFLMGAVGGRAKLPESVADNILIAGLLFYVLGIALSVTLWAQSGLPGAP